MNIVNNLLSFLVALVPGMILSFGLVAVSCILLFSIILVLSETEVVTKSSKTGMVTEYYNYNLVTKPNAIQTGIESDKADLLAKLDMEITPDYNVHLKISQKNQILTGISLKVDPSFNACYANAKVQIRDDALEDISLDEQSCVLTCEQLNDTCTLTTYVNHNEPTVQNLPSSGNNVWILLETLSDSSQKVDGVGSTDTSENRKTKKKKKAYPKNVKDKKNKPTPFSS